MDLHTRLAKLEDEDFIWDVYQVVARPLLLSMTAKIWNPQHEWDRFLDVFKWHRAHIIELGETPVGWFAADERARSSVVVDHFYMHPSHQRHGYGSEIWQRLLARWRAAGKTSIEITVFKDVWAKSYLARHGFVTLREEGATEILSAPLSPSVGSSVS